MLGRKTLRVEVLAVFSCARDMFARQEVYFRGLFVAQNTATVVRHVLAPSGDRHFTLGRCLCMWVAGHVMKFHFSSCEEYNSSIRLP